MNFSPFLGKGAKFPFSIDGTTGGIKKVSSETYSAFSPIARGDSLEKINDSILHILSTPIGTRLFLPEFGSNLYRLVFEPNDDVFADLARVYIASALQKWERRIIVLSIDIVTNSSNLKNHTATFNINYKIIGTQITGNFVYPFVRSI